ncbi:MULTISPECIES: VOC family protein [unclassified Roseovarius]|uniref:VOC family protein n=1 Tax=unclassified Roseovarius TaxID=2614913 RepID=UPI00273DCC40|nr:MULTISPECIES: VOC family protein [unclassified Roseovarius]
MQFQQLGTVVAELWCHDFHESLAFYTDKVGFSVGQHKEGSTHAYLVFGQSQIMISHFDYHGTWETGPYEKPLGRGINFSFFVDDVQSLHDRLVSKGVKPFVETYTIWYWRPDCMENYMEFAILDPDGYMLRFSERIGSRPHEPDDDDHKSE